MKPNSSSSSKRFLKAAGSIMRPLASIAISNSPKKKLIISGFNTCYKYKITTFTTIYHNLTQNILSTLKKKHKSLETNEKEAECRSFKNEMWIIDKTMWITQEKRPTTLFTNLNNSFIYVHKRKYKPINKNYNF